MAKPFTKFRGFWAKPKNFLRSKKPPKQGFGFAKIFEMAKPFQKPPTPECGGLGGIPPTLAVRLVGSAHKTITLFR